MEVSEIAAIVSLNEVKLRQNMRLKPLSKNIQEKLQTKSELVFELVESGYLQKNTNGGAQLAAVVDPLTPESMFTLYDD